jgi:autotransporter-associated beta strand protein
MAGRILLGSGLNTTMNVVDGTLTVSAPLQAGDSGILGGLVKTGTGRLVLSAANIYSSPTTINGGTLELTGSLLAASGVTSPSNITVASGATFKGTGTAAGTLAANGIIAPGSSIGTLSVGATAFSATGSLSAEINSSTLTYDKLAVTGNLSIDPAATLNITDLGSGTPTSAKLVLVSYTGTWDGGTFAGTTNGGSVVVNGNTYTIKYDDTDGGLNAVTLRIGSGDPYESWASGYSLVGGNALKGADPDGDGVKNILEFATASDPTSGSSGPRIYPLMFTIGADNALTFTAAVRKNAVFAPSGVKQTATQDLVVYTVEASNDLTNWTTVQVTEVTGTDKTNIQSALGSKLTTPALGADWEWHTFRTDGGTQLDPSDHIRLKVNEAP